MNPRKPVLALAILLSGILAFAQASRSTIVILPFAHDASVSDNETGVLRDSLISAILEKSDFSLLDTKSSEAVADQSAAIAIAKDLKSDFIMTGRAARLKQKGVSSFAITLRLSATDTGAELFGKQDIFPEAKLIDGMASLAKKITIAAKQRSDVNLATVDAFVKAEDWTNAERYIGLLQAAKPEQAQALATRQASVDRAVALVRFSDAQKAEKNGLFEIAIRAAREAATRQPENATYADYARALEEKNAAFVAASESSRLDTIEGYLRDRKYDLASALLKIVEAPGGASARAIDLRARIESGLQARALRVDAATFLDAGKYAEALASADKALAAIPDDPESIRLRIAIQEKEKQEAATKERWSLYLQELKGYDYGQLYLSKKPLTKGLRAGADACYIESTDMSAEGYATLTRGPFPELFVIYELPLLTPFRMPWSFSDFKLFGFGALRGGGGSWRTTLDGSTPITTDTLYFADLEAGARARLGLGSFYLDANALLGTGPLGISRSQRAAFSSDKTSASEFTWLLDFGLGASLGWMLSDRYSLSFEYLWRGAMLQSDSAFLDGAGISSTGLSLGIRM